MSTRTPRRSPKRPPKKSARRSAPAHDPLDLPGSPALKSARSPGGSRVVDVHMTGMVATRGAPAGNGTKMEDMTEAERVALWKAGLAQDSDDDVSMGSADDEADAVMRKFGVAPPAAQGPEEKFQGEFEWSGFEQVNDITQENQALMAAMAEKDAEIDRLRDIVLATEPIPGLDPERLLDIRVGTDMIDQDPRDIKIMSLAKKVRMINLKLQRERTRSAALEKERDGYQEVAESKMYPQRLKPSATGSSEAEELEAKLRKTKSQVKQLSSRLNEYRVKADRFETEMKKARNALRKEVGPKADLDKVVEEGSNWRGRAQKLVMMKARIKELQEQLQQRGTRDDVDSRAKAELAAMEQERLRGMEQLGEELQAAQQQAVTYKRKMEAAKARATVLARDNKKAKENISTLLKKTGNDDELIDALRQEVHDSRRRLAAMSSDLSSTRADLARTTSVAGGMPIEGEDYERLQRQNADRKRQLAHQEKIISSLRGELRAARAGGRSGSASGAPRGGGGRRPSRPSSAELRSAARNEMEAQHYEANLKMLQLDNSKQSELVEVLKAKLRDAEANAEAAIQRASQLDGLCRKYEQERGHKRNGTGSRSGRRATPQTTAALQEEIESMKRDAEALRKTYRTSLRAREEEISTMKDQMQRMQQTYQTQVNAMRRGSRPPSSAAGEVEDSSEAVAQLEQDNEILVQELSDLRAENRKLRGEVKRLRG